MAFILNESTEDMAAFNNKSSRRKKRFPVPPLPIISTLLLLAAVGLFVRELIGFSQQEDRLPLSLTVADIDVSGMTRAQAQVAWVEAYARPVILYYGDSPITLDPASVGFRTNWQMMMTEATSIGSAEGSFWRRFFNHLTQQQFEQAASLPLIADYQESLLRQFLEDISRRYDEPSGSPGYDVQTLTTFSGNPGRVLDIEASIRAVDLALRSPFNRTVILPLGGIDSSRPGLDTLRNLIIAFLDSRGFMYDGQTTIASVYVMDLRTGEEMSILGDVAFSAASTMKLPILIDYFRYLRIDPTQDEAWLMANSLLCSNNASSNLLMQIIGGGDDIFAGLARVTQTMQYLGARNTYIAAPFVEGVSGQRLGSIEAPRTNPNPQHTTNPDRFNQTTAEDMGTLLNLLYDCAQYGSGLITAFPDGEFSQRECQRMINLIAVNDLERLLQGGIPVGTRIAHKNGWLEIDDAGMVANSGIVFAPNGNDYIVSVFLWEDTPARDFELLWPLLEDISRAVWNYFVPEQALLERRELPFAAQECEGNYLPPPGQVNLDDMRAWRSSG